MFFSSQAGANFNATDKVLRTPLLEAVVNNHMDVAKYLVQCGACVYHQVTPQVLSVDGDTSFIGFS